MRDEKDWKLKPRYGKLETTFQHFTFLVDGLVETPLQHGFSCPVGPAWMGIRIWATSTEQAKEITVSIAKQIGLSSVGEIQIFQTDPKEPPKENPYGYDINFHPCSK